MGTYRDGYTKGIAFVARYQSYPKLVLVYARYHMKRYNQTPSDAGFIDAINLAFGA